MNLLDGFIYKIAELPWEIEAVHALNYKTFVEEIPQHQPNVEKVLTDKFHRQNTYIICVDEERKILAGMIAFRHQRPFSLDSKLENLDSYLPENRSLCEIRLLAVTEKYRFTRISQGLIAQLVQHATDCGYDMAVISGTIHQAKLYKFLGFVPFGPVVGSGDAQYQPMYLTVEAYSDLKTRSSSFARDSDELANDDRLAFNFLPGPVDFSKPVQDAHSEPPCSHRGPEFAQDFGQTRRLLCEMTGAARVQLLMGPGTLANDAIAAQLGLLQQVGLVLVSGEFGRRLVNNARGARLSFETFEIAEGAAFERHHLEQALDQNPDARWVWATHCETSTGVLNDIDIYQQVCQERRVRLCLDCISSLGTVPVDLSGVYLASATSGKGMASIAGVAMVFHNHELASAPEQIPCAIDLGLYQQSDGIPYTIQSNLVHALLASLKVHDWQSRFEEVRRWSTSIRSQLHEIGVSALAPESCAMPSVVTIALASHHCSEEIGDALKKHGVLVSYQSRYLRDRNWIQACRLGADSQPAEKLVRLLRKKLKPARNLDQQR
ncbi:MAG: aminotransferase class V-fold PLP-dependent enzyme [Planctomycetota bacterium]|nr:aminotransferase class V-fold PLP-dependent enzyme [Planctomycetota bacterium]